ncbi:hypothetical protein PWG14_16920 (plasmid) [Chromobacterium amazonense]|uniref:hypothetical protein n=1 Tax=Chromobacterium amazonense TaxID=1382803 RepID=UPI00237D7619|nr:hypothetical protein [Chromobacterium amazonense]MDE1714213.1 hypothetical protein [Chromobacterium amazonense]
MPSTIPYDPSLALGNIVSLDKLKVLEDIAKAQAPADVAEDTLNSLISMKRSLDMTVQEMINMGVNAAEVITASEDAGKQIAAAASQYAKAKIQAEKDVQPLKATMRAINDSLESPIDYNRTEIKKMPISADSLRMNVQYFAVDENAQSSGTHAATVSAFVSEQVSYFGDEFSAQASVSTASQVNSQLSRHSISGTLVISLTCTHKNAALLAPFILDVDKGIRVWNQVHPDAMIKTDSYSEIAKIAAQANTPDEKTLTLLSGATYGSCFIGMVHVLNTTTTASSETMYSIADKLQAQFSVNSWFVNASGGFGVENSFSNDVKNLLSTQNVSAHCSLVTMGLIPSIKSNQVIMAVKGFSDDDGAKSMAALMKLQNATASEQDSVDKSAEAARLGKQMIALQNSKIEATLSGLAEIDKQENKIIDTNSVMDALDDFIQKAIAGDIGVPITYYLKPITRSQLAQMWMSKYYPSKFLSISGDDSHPAGGGSSSGGASDSSGSDSSN